MSSEFRNVLVFINETDPGGHSDDIRTAIYKALNKVNYSVFQDLPKKPENTFDAIIDEILLSESVILDGVSLYEGISPDFLIHYGICYPLNKKSLFLFVKNNSCMAKAKQKPQVIEGVLHFEYYLDVGTELKSKVIKWLDDHKTNYKDESTKKPVHAFEVFGVNNLKSPDLYREISDFAINTDWKPKFHSDLGSFSALQELARSVGARSFNIFCLDKDNEENIYIGIGIAIGMGRPFLIVKHKDIELPLSLSGYNGLLEYDSFSQLRDKLRQYADIFLSEKVLEWQGATYYRVLSRIERQVDQYGAVELERAESIINAVNSAIGSTLAKSYALLGDIYREKNRKIAPNDSTLLLKAKKFYEQALKIQSDYKRCEDALSVIDTHIEVIELLTSHQYKSFPRLLTLIGENLTSKSYSYIREYLIGEVSKLIQNQEYVNAIALLAAMQVHDKSEEIQNLVTGILKAAPSSLSVEVIQDSQKYIIDLEKEMEYFLAEINSKEEQIGRLSAQMGDAKLNIENLKEKILEVQKERDELKSKIEAMYAQFLSVQKTNENLEKLVTNDVLRNKIEISREIKGRGVVVNFGGIGWAVYKTFNERPYVIRDKELIDVHEGFVLIDGDTIRDETGIGENYLPPDTISIRPDDDLYQIIKEIKEDE